MGSNAKNIIILFFTLVVIMLGFGMIIPIMPFYIDAFGASGRELGFLMAEAIADPDATDWNATSDFIRAFRKRSKEAWTSASPRRLITSGPDTKAQRYSRDSPSGSLLPEASRVTAPPSSTE